MELSGSPLAKKLGLKSDSSLLVINSPEPYFKLLGLVIAELKERMPVLKHLLTASGMMWISWPKKSSKRASVLSGNIVREIGLDLGLVDVKVCSINDDWSGLKFVYPLKDRT